MLESAAKRAAEAYLSADVAARRAEAAKLLALTELAESYSCADPDVFVDALVEQSVRIGGDGTPLVSEFVSLEAAGLIGCSASTATSKLADALDLKHRHQWLWEAVQNLELEAYRALHVARKCRMLDQRTADQVGFTWAQRQAGLPWSASQDLLDQLLVALDPEGAAQKEALALAERKVNVWGFANGTMNLFARLDVLDARYLDAAVEQIADILEAGLGDTGEVDGQAHLFESRAELRSRALGVLAHPAHALAILQRAAQQPLFSSEVSPTDPGPIPEELWAAILASSPAPPAGSLPDLDEPEPSRSELADERWRDPGPPPHWALRPHDPSPPCSCNHRQCGTIDVPLAKLRPKAEVKVHINAADLLAYGQGNLRGSAWIEKAGHVTLETFVKLFGRAHLTVKPVVDLNSLADEDRYRPTAGLRDAVEYLMPTESFIFSNRRSSGLDIGLDLDHTMPHGTCGGVTGLGNLQPLTRRVHRAKTAGHWRVEQQPGCRFIWTSPLGYRYERSPGGTTRLYPLPA